MGRTERARWRGLWGLGVGIVALGWVSPALGVTVEPPDGIQEAIDAAAPGEVITLAPGTFEESVTLKSGVTLEGAGVDETVVTGVVTVPGGADSVTLQGFTAGGLTSWGTGLVVSEMAFGGTASFEGGAATVEGVRFDWYLVGKGQADVTFRNITTSNVPYSQEQAVLRYEDSTFTNLYYASGSSRTTFVRCTLGSVYASGDATVELDDSGANWELSASERAGLVLTGSSAGSLTIAGEVGIEVTGSTLGDVRFVIPSGVSATVAGVAPGLVSAATGSGSTGGFALAMEETTISGVGLDVSGDLTFDDGGVSLYSYVRTGGVLSMTGGRLEQVTWVEAGGQAWLSGTHVAHNVDVWGELVLSGTTAEGSLVTTWDQGEVRLEAGAHHDRVKLAAAGALTVSDARLDRLLLYASEGYAAVVDGLEPGLGTGTPVTAGADSGPTLVLEQGEVDGIELWIQGEADVTNSRVNGYTVVERDGVARISDTTFEADAFFWENGTVICDHCTSTAFLYAQGNADVTLEQGTVRNYAALRGNSVNRWNGVLIDGLVYTTEHAVSTLNDCYAPSNRVEVGGTSTTEIVGGELSSVKALETGNLILDSAVVDTLIFEVGPGLDMVIDGFVPGDLTATFGPGTQGPSATLTTTTVHHTSVLNHGTVHVLNSVIDGYNFVYEGAESHYQDSAFLGDTYFQPGSVNEVVGCTLDCLLNVRDSTNTFVETTFASASVLIGGASHNTFTSCVFTNPLTLQDESVNNFGEIAGDNPGLNDFSLADGYFKLANHTPNDVMAQNCIWGSEDIDEIYASFIIDVDDDDPDDEVVWGRVYVDPVAVTNRLPVVDAGDDLFVASDEQESFIIPASAVDPDGDLLTYQWLEGDHVLFGPAPVDPETGDVSLDLGYVEYLGYGEHTLTLEVEEDDTGEVVRDQMVLTIGNAAPVATASGSGTYAYDEPVALGGEVSDYDGDILTYTWWFGEEPLASGEVETVVEGTPVLLPEFVVPPGTFPLGHNLVTLEVSDGPENASVLSTVDIEIVDYTPPVLSPVAEPSILWPPNGRMREVTIYTYAMDAAGGPVTLEASVTSNEPPSRFSGGQDWTEPEIDQETGVITVWLRAERNKWGIGRMYNARHCRRRPHPLLCGWRSRRGAERVYTILISAEDESGNRAESSVEVKVPGWGFWH